MQQEGAPYPEDTRGVRHLDAVPTPTPTATPHPVPDVPEPTAPAEAEAAVESLSSAPAAAPTGAPMGQGGDTTRAIICSYSWDCAVAIRVFTCESGLRADAISYNGSSYGVAQIWKGHAGRFPGFWERWMIPEVNIGWAHELWSEQGWGPWNESRSCWWVP